MGSWCGGAIALCPLACVAGAVAAVAPQPDVHGYGSGWDWLGVSLLLVLAG